MVLAAALLSIAAFAAPQGPARSDSASATTTAKAAKTTERKAASAAKKTSQAKPPAKVAKAEAKSTGKSAGKKKSDRTAVAKRAESKLGPLADFGKSAAPADVVHLANWVSYTRNHNRKAFVVIDKKAAQLYVFDPKGKLRSRTPVLLGKAVGDHSAPGVGNKPLSQLREDEKTTPAGRFVAIPGKNTHGDDIIWIDYKAAVSMHRLRKVGNERRAERMATADISDNRISNGCVNVPPKFYDSVLKPTVMKNGAFVYVLPETRSPQQLFGSFDVPAQDKRVQVADASASAQGKTGK